MFYRAENLNQDFSKWNTSKVTNMNLMFYDSNYDQDVSSWDVYNVISWDNFASEALSSNSALIPDKFK